MSCPTIAIFENNKEGTQKRVHINLGWYTPSHFDMAKILITAGNTVDSSYNWDRVVVPIIDSYVTRENFEKVKRVVNEIDNHPSSHMYRKNFTLDSVLNKH